MPPPGAGEAAPEHPKAEQSGMHSITDGPAPAESPPAAEKQPPQLPFVHSQNEQQPEGVFLSDDQFMNDFMRESHTAPLAVLLIAAALSFIIYGYQGFMASDPGMGIAGAFGTCIVIALLMGVSCLTSTAAGWIICKLFGEDYGSAGGLLLRFSAVAAAQLPIFAVIDAMVGGLLSLLFIVPVVLVLAMVIGGFDVVRAFLYCVILSVVNWILIAFIAVSFATAVMG
jgi:TM2 domain-containing membrane protein YozV